MDLFKGIVEQRQDVLNHLYKSLFPIVKKLIFKQGGDYDTANDIFQETIILLYRKAKAGKLSEKMMVESYIVGMCKIIWLQHYEKETQNNSLFSKVNIEEQMGVNETAEEYRQSLRMKLFYEHFKNLSSDCQEVLKAFFAGTNFSDMAKQLGLVSEEYARRKKYLCKETLVKSIKSDPEFSKLIGGYDEELFEID